MEYYWQGKTWRIRRSHYRERPALHGYPSTYRGVKAPAPGNFETVCVWETVCYVSERSAQIAGQPQVSGWARELLMFWSEVEFKNNLAIAYGSSQDPRTSKIAEGKMGMACGDSTTRSRGTEAAERVYSPFAPFRHLLLASNTCLNPELAEVDRIIICRVPGKPK